MNIENLKKRLLVARCMYANGLSFISDAEYDGLLTELKEQGVTLNPIYEDDPIPYEAFADIKGYSREEVDKLLGITNENTSYFNAPDEIDLDFLSESESLSIASVTSFGEAYNWFREHEGLEVIISTKVDGINTRRGYHYDSGYLKFKASLTRGRRSDPINITTNMRKISPQHILADITEDLIVYSETVTTSESIAIMNEKYGTDYTIPRGLAMAMMRADRFSDEDFIYLKSYVFRVDYGNRQSDGLELARKLGFDVVPYLYYTYQGEDYESFVNKMENFIKELKEQTDAIGIVTDGMVAEVNDRAYYGCAAVTNNYSSANLALKIGLWKPGVYQSEVVSLDLSQQAERCACVAIVKPVIAAGGQKISRVNCYNPATLFYNNIKPGSVIRFEYKNETTVNLLVDTI